MQKRFCTCGHMVFVRYLCTNGKWRPLILGSQRNRKSAPFVCPVCGVPLTIHTLR